MLRPYQHECVEQTLKAADSYPSGLIVMATGLGKTVVFCEIIRRWLEERKGIPIVMAHRDFLINQAVRQIKQWTGLDAEVEMASQWANIDRLKEKRVPLVTSVQTMSRDRMLRFKPEDFGLLVIDEAHHAPSQSYQKVIWHFRKNHDLFVLGPTATPKRADEVAMGSTFETVIFEMGIEEGIQDGWLVPIEQVAITIEGLDFSKCRERMNDLRESDLEKIFKQEEMLHKISKPSAEIAGGRRMMAFCPSVAIACGTDESPGLNNVLQRYGVDARGLSGESSEDLRQAIIGMYARGEIQSLCNCALFLEGFDCPQTEVIVMARPTKSLALYTQVLGRGTRSLPGVIDGLRTAQERRNAIAKSAKPKMTVIDLVGNSGKHKLIRSFDILGGKYSEAVRQYASRYVQKNGGGEVYQVLEMAEDFMEAEQHIDQWIKHREKIKAEVAYRTEEVSPFDTSHLPRRQVEVSTAKPNQEPHPHGATEKQINLLIAMGMEHEKAKALAFQATGRKQAGVILNSYKEKGTRPDWKRLKWQQRAKWYRGKALHDSR